MRELQTLLVTTGPAFSGLGFAASARSLGILTLANCLLAACAGGASDSVGVDPVRPQLTQLTVTSEPLPDGVLQVPYNKHKEPCTPTRTGVKCECSHTALLDYCYRWALGFQLAAAGGTEPYRWTLATGSGLPPGLEMPPFGLIDGTPAAAGSYEFTVSVSDSSTPPLEGSAHLAIKITLPSPPQISQVSLPSSVVNQPYSFAFGATEGPLPLTWSESGALPPGLSLGTDGVISGTATATGSYPIIVMVRDSAGQSATPQSFTLDVAAHGFVRASGMLGPRCFHTATLVNDGRVLLVGMQEVVELYDPASGAFVLSTPETYRVHHTATRLANGRVLIAGGDDLDGALPSAELYDPASATLLPVGAMGSARDSFTATLLGDGRVLVAGGGGPNGNQASAELFDPTTGSFAATGSMSTPRALHRATLLGNGKVLITGGVDADGNFLASAELYDPATGTFAPTGSMKDQRSGHTATLLADGRVLVAGRTANGVPSAELYDPASAIFSPTGRMGAARANHTATRLRDGTVLVAGGTDEANQALIAAELYDPRTGLFARTGSLQSGRQFHTATLLIDGKVLVTGGHEPESGILTSAELYQ